MEITGMTAATMANTEVPVSSLDERINFFQNEPQSALATQEYFVNMGPQHPSTHGVLRLVLKMDGETVREIIPVLGYVHRGMEKKAEYIGYRQQVHLTDRLDYLCALMNNWVMADAVERAMKIELNDRILTLRTIIAELQRIQSHQLWWGVFGMDLGAFTPFLYGFRDREKITAIFEDTMGARLTMNYIQPGGLMYDIHPEFPRKVKDFLKYFKPILNEYDELFTGNVIVHQRLKGIGILDGKTAISVGASGPVLRASGVSYDLRKSDPYGVYSKAQFEVPVGTTGDCWDRYIVRMQEMRESIRIVEQLIDNIPEGPTMVMKFGAKIRIPEGIYYNQMETARGILGVMLVADGTEKPYRLHFRTPNFNNLWSVISMAKGLRLADLVAILSSVDIVVPDIDR
ncbi:MAG: NADH-quinone oxidoreductase subunit D [Bdellovibrionaceae bacterium]|nr:NADH-quinone oxidoreductase subunit D [Pseudobdellovibrionaceae bacterium]